MVKDFSTALCTYIKDALNIEVVEGKRDTAFEQVAGHHEQKKVTFPFATVYMTGDVELDTTRYNAYLHRVGQVIVTDRTTKTATRVRAIPITHPYTIDLWAQNKDRLGTLRKTLLVAVLDTPVVNVFSRDTRMTYRTSLDIQATSTESANQFEERAGYCNMTLNANLGVWIRLASDVNVITKMLITYMQSPEDYILDVQEVDA